MTDMKLTSTEVVYVLVEAKAVGSLTVSGDDPVVITGLHTDRHRARRVLKGHGLTFESYPDRDEWLRR